MNNLKIISNKIRNMFSHPFMRIVVVSVTTVVVTLLIVAFVLYQYRGKLFQYFSNSFTPQQISSANLVQIEKQLETGNIAPSDIAAANIISQTGTVVDVVKKTKPAVVSIIAYQPADTTKGTARKKLSSGSGFIISKDGLIVTNNHVVDQTGVEYTAILNSGKEYTATVLAKDNVLDVALVKIIATNLPYLSFGDSDKIEVGQTVVAIGNALGQFENTVSSGVISGLSRSITAGNGSGQTEKLDKVIQTDAAINPGNSGGPLLDLTGKVIGINVARVSGSSNVGFSIPINSVKDTISSVEKTGKIVRPYAGITSDIQTKNNLPVDYGIWIQPGATPTDYAVLPGSPAEKAGIKSGDIILSVNGQNLDATHDFTSFIRSEKVGNTVVMKVLSNGLEKTVNVVLEQIPDGL